MTWFSVLLRPSQLRCLVSKCNDYEETLCFYSTIDQDYPAKGTRAREVLKTWQN